MFRRFQSWCGSEQCSFIVIGGSGLKKTVKKYYDEILRILYDGAVAGHGPNFRLSGPTLM